MFKEQHKPTTPPTTGAQAKPSRSERATGKPKAQNGQPTVAQPAARFMPTGDAPKPAGQQPAYKLRQKLADLDLQLQHPHLDRLWRKKIGGVPMPQVVGTVIRGRQGAAKAQQDEQ